MAYVAPYIDETGMHIPTYNDIVESLCEEAKRIFGQGLYLGADSMDYQLIAAFAEKVNDSNEAALAAYMSHSPTSSVGTGLDAIVAINGVKRKVATCSVSTVELRGVPSTVIRNGMVSDTGNGYIWDLPQSVTIGDSGSVTAIATCREPGVIYAAAGTITVIKTPTRGWVSVTNASPSTVGSQVETDSELRARRAMSVALPSQSILDGLYSGLMSIDNVAMVLLRENDTGSTDADGIPAHSICAVVEGGENEAIAREIYDKKAPGCGTYGTTSVTVVDAGGGNNVIKFMRPVDVDLTVAITYTIAAGYSDFTQADKDAIVFAVVEYINSLGLAQPLFIDMIRSVAFGAVKDSVGVGFRGFGISVTDGTTTVTQGAFEFAFDERASVVPEDVTLTKSV